MTHAFADALRALGMVYPGGPLPFNMAADAVDGYANEVSAALAASAVALRALGLVYPGGPEPFNIAAGALEAQFVGGSGWQSEHLTHEMF